MQKHMRYYLVGLLVAFLGTACASYTPSPTPVPIVQQGDWHVSNGLAVAVYPYVRREQNQQVFNVNLDFERAGVIPLQVIVENRTERTILVRPLDMVLTLPDRRTLGPTSVASVANIVEENGDPGAWDSAFGAYSRGAVLGHMVSSIFATNAEEKAKQARVADYEAKSLRRTQLASGQSSTGFVFFVPPRGSGAFDEATLSVFFFDEAAVKTEEVQVPLKGLEFMPW